jgi:hypothetical protein
MDVGQSKVKLVSLRKAPMNHAIAKGQVLDLVRVLHSSLCRLAQAPGMLNAKTHCPDFVKGVYAMYTSQMSRQTSTP